MDQMHEIDLKLNDLRKTYLLPAPLLHRRGQGKPKTKQALAGVSLTLGPGLYGLLGPNGAGKSTLLKMLCGMLRPTSGEIAFAGRPWTRDDLNDIGALIESPPLYDNLTARENLRVRTSLLGVPESRIDEALATVGLPETGRKRAGQFSMGMKQRLGLAMALMGAVLVLPLVTRNSVSVTGDVVIAVAGSLSVLLYLFWMQLFGRLSAQSMFLTLFLSQVLTCAINAIISIANIYTVVATSIALPLVSTICLRVGQREHADERPSSEVPASQEGHGASTLMLVKLAAIVFAWGVIDHLFRSEFDAFMRTQVTTSPFAVAYHAAAFVVVVAAVAFAYALLAYRERFQFGHLYRMIFLLGLASILLLPIVLAGQATIVGYTCSVIMYQLVFLLVWVIAASVFRDSPTHAPGFFGLVYGFWSLGSLGGALFSSVFVQHLTMDNVHLIVFAAVLAVAVGYAVMFTEADANALVQIVPYKRKAPFKAKCQAVAQEYQLSPRETEIAMLIAQGRDSAHIEKKLFLSRSTVQTHRMHLYQKLDIQNPQELLDIIEAADAS